MSTAEHIQLSNMEFETVKDADLQVTIAPYVTIGIVILFLSLFIHFIPMPNNADKDHSLNLGKALKHILSILRTVRA